MMISMSLPLFFPTTGKDTFNDTPESRKEKFSFEWNLGKVAVALVTLNRDEIKGICSNTGVRGSLKASARRMSEDYRTRGWTSGNGMVGG